jgi:membrane-associated protein
MSELSVIELFLTGILVYGTIVFGLALFVSALGIPLPSSLMVLAGGAFVQQGVMEWKMTFLFGLLGAVLGDSASYAMGHVAKGWVQRRFGQTTTWQTAQRSFNRGGAIAIYLTRFFITPLAVPTNLIAASSGYRFRRFLFFDVAGEVTWLVVYGGLGYLFGNNWEVISQLLSDVSGLLAGVVILAIGMYFLVRRRRRS